MNAMQNDTQTAMVSPPANRATERLLLTIKEVAFALNASTKTVRRLIAKGEFKPCRAVRKILIPRWQIEEFLKRNCGTPRTLK